MAGISAAMAGGSMSAHAIIQAVPAPAVLIPFVANDTAILTNGTFTTNFRIEVPSSVGLDSVVNLFDGPDTTPAGAIPSSGVATGLATSVGGAASSATSKLHWYFMDRRSNEVLNSAFPVSANDVIEFNSGAMPTNSGTISLGDSAIGYLVIVNESASLGGAPSFAFQADAFVTNTFTPAPPAPQVEVRLVNNIPVYPLTDTADNQAASPTLVNNVLEDVSGVPAGAPYGGGPIVSPLMSGIRLAAANAGGATQGWFRVIDFPINGANAAATARGEYYVVWSDRTDSLNLVNGALVDTPAITGSVVTYDCNENQISGAPLSLDDQLNVVHISNTSANPPSPLFNDVEVSLGNTGACVNANPATGPSGFLRWFAQPNPYNVGGLTNAAYQAGVIFRLRQGALDGYSQFPVDRGFFTAK
jgi:hypothetical protein